MRREEACYQELVALAGRIGLQIGHERRFVLAHPMCTARMAVDPADGVVDGNLRIHGVDNAFVCGSASFASGAAANPTLTIAALAHCLGAHLTGEVLAANGGPAGQERRSPVGDGPATTAALIRAKVATPYSARAWMKTMMPTSSSTSSTVWIATYVTF